MHRMKIIIFALVLIVLVSIAGAYGFLIEPYGVVFRHLWIQYSGIMGVLKGHLAIHLWNFIVHGYIKRPKTVSVRIGLSPTNSEPGGAGRLVGLIVGRHGTICNTS